mgnify:CR=1 FL=1
MNKILKILAPVTLILLLTSCTPYQSAGFTGGFTEAQLSETVWKVKVNGNGLTAKSTIDDYALLRASELTLEEGYRYFIVGEENQFSKEGVADFGSTSTTQGHVDRNGYFSGTTTTKKNAHNYTKHRNEILFQMTNEQQNGVFTYNAKMIFDSLSKKYIK